MMKSNVVKPLFALLLISVLALSQGTMASPITRQQAQQNALSFMQNRGKSVSMSSLRHAPMRDATQVIAPYYVFNIGDGQGYVIASGDDCTPAVLGYADSGAIDIDNLPCNLKAWLDGYAQQIQYLQANGLSISRAPKKIASHPAIAPMLTCHWYQNDPYNMYCPIDPSDGNRCVTGCVATAMAELLYYHRANTDSQLAAEIPAYRTRTRNIHVDAIPAGSFIDWENMIDDYGDGSNATELQIQAVANLMKYCGAAVEMNYTSSNSGAYFVKVVPALKRYFGFSLQTKEFHRSNYTNVGWEELIYSDLSKSRPVLCCGESSTQSHSFIVDGYDGNGFFHINFGWNGENDGYYLLTAAESSDALQPFQLGQSAVINAHPYTDPQEPDEIVNFVDPVIRDYCLSKWDQNDDGVLSVPEAAAVTNFSLGSFMTSFGLRNTITSFDEFQYFTGVTSLGTQALYYCVNMTSVILPNSLTSIGLQALARCSSLTELVIPNSVKTIEAAAFDGCEGLTSITIPNSVISLGQEAFNDCTGLTSVILGRGLNSIGYQAFAKSTLATVTSLSLVPPQMVASVFENSYATATLRVPVQAVDTYRSTDPWSRFGNIVGIDPSLGDVNMDDEVGVADVNALIDRIMGSEGDCLSDFMSDVNGDGEINIADINSLIDRILGN